MYTFRMAAQLLGTQVMIGAVSNSSEFVRSISRAVPGNTSLRADALYYGAPSTMEPLLAVWNGTEPLALIFSETASLQALYCTTLLQNPLISWAISPLSTAALGDLLMNGYFLFHQWWDDLQEDIYRRCGLQPFLQKIATQVQRPIFLLNSGYRLLASDVNYSFEDQYIQELLFQGALSDDSIQALLPKLSNRHKMLSLDTKSNAATYGTLLENQHYAITCELRDKRTLYGYLLILAETDQPDYLMQDYAHCAATLFTRYMAAEHSEQFESGEGFSDFIQDLIEWKLKTAAQIKARASKVNLTHLSQYFCVLVSLDETSPEKDFSRLAPALQQLFPGSKSTVYNDELLLMVSTSLQKRLECNLEQLEKIAESYHAVICLGSGTITLGAYPIVYQQTRSALHLAMKLAPDKRVIRWEKYQLYQIIELCHLQGQDFHQNNLAYLCSPRYISLLNHDRKNKDNLCEILKVYLENDCNASQTAKELYLHRNTLINKLDKIESILEGQLSDCSLRFSLYLSVLVAEYTAKCLGRDIMLLRFGDEAPSSPLYKDYPPA